MMIRARRGPTRLPKYGQPRDMHFRSGVPANGGEPPKKGCFRRLFGCGLFLFFILTLPTFGLVGVALLVGRWAA